MRSQIQLNFDTSRVKASAARLIASYSVGNVGSESSMSCTGRRRNRILGGERAFLAGPDTDKPPYRARVGYF